MCVRPYICALYVPYMCLICVLIGAYTSTVPRTTCCASWRASSRSPTCSPRSSGTLISLRTATHRYCFVSLFFQKKKFIFFHLLPQDLPSGTLSSPTATHRYCFVDFFFIYFSSFSPRSSGTLYLSADKS